MAQNISHLNTCASAVDDYDDERIIGGRNAKINKSPWFACLLLQSMMICGGSIISNTKILTAAHCVAQFPATMLQVRVGSTMWSRGGQVVRVTRSVMHPSYNNPPQSHDIAVLSVSRIAFNRKSIAKVNLPSTKRRMTFSTGTMLYVCGFGVTESGSISMSLRAVTVPLVEQQQCIQSYGRIITSDMLCAGYKMGRRDACQGDSGGPLTRGKTQVGVVSFGEGCGKPTKYGVYAKVSRFTKWIRKNMK